MSENTKPAAAAAMPSWDDTKFIERVEALALAREMTLAEVATAAKMPKDYFVKRRGQAAGRNIISIVRLAGALGVPVSALVEEASHPQKDGAEPPPFDPVKLERLATVASAAAHLYVALDGRKATVPDDIDAEELLQVLMRFIEPRRKRG